MSQVTTTFYTQSHRLEGDLVVTERLSEKLNDPLTDFIELRDARISSLARSSAAAAVSWPVATIPKSAILLATLDMQQHESRQTRIDKVQSKQGSQVGAIVGTIEVYGTGHLRFSGSAARVMSSQLQPFFPITNAVLQFSQREEDNRVGTGLALINRDMVRAFTLS
jgi:hypothetical protein